jgi:hypothetical protein
MKYPRHMGLAVELELHRFGQARVEIHRPAARYDLCLDHEQFRQAFDRDHAGEHQGERGRGGDRADPVAGNGHARSPSIACDHSTGPCPFNRMPVRDGGKRGAKLCQAATIALQPPP